MIEKYRSCLIIIIHLRGEILWGIIDYVAIFGNTRYGCLLLRFSFHTLLLALFLYFCISSAASGYLRVFVSGIFPCRPVLLTLGLGHSVGLDESLRALAQIPAQCKPLGIVPSCIVFARILFYIVIFFVLHIYVLTLARIPAHCKPLGILPSYYNHKFGCILSIVFLTALITM